MLNKNKDKSFQKQGFWKKRSLGQNFLINRGVLDKTINAAELTKKDTVIEIGPGTGNLTEKLSERVKNVVAIEKDSRIISFLREKFAKSNVEIIEGDVLNIGAEVSRSQASGREYKVVGNIPYYITSNLLRKIFEEWARPSLIVLMVQKEVAQRIVAKPPRMNLLALSVQFFAEPKIISYVSRGSFRPMPKVDSAIIRLVPKKESYSTTALLRYNLFNLIRTAFAGKRKQLKNTIGLEILQKAGIRPESRPEKLSLEDWLKIVSEV